MKRMTRSAALALAVISGSAAADDRPITVTPAGSAPSVTGAAENFTGHVIVDLLTPSSLVTPAATGQVTFAPGARTAWHSHPAGQMLIVTAGKGWVEKEGEPKHVIAAGDTVWIPAGVKHWHGATDTTGMSHIAVTYIRDGKNAEWFEPVSDEQYKGR
ncbi:cupin domain-containing protein [Leclercia adecarboxylata]|uniref:(R)-mandelonitrile lyase n=1 Tax=Leclercia adecarboxylata TaxID=83655 RepID=UPI002DBB9C63|nr:cupin domain-containing protein [Leclercia adecarboxylata]MEB6378994.1 cupin domain-containing protein [Leclercia adecarboxylata]